MYLKFSLAGSITTGTIYLNGDLLTPTKSLKIVNHSPDGFSWGYGGSGSSQLALAILLEFVPENKAILNYQSFKWAVIAELPQTDFMTEIKYEMP